MGDTAICIHPEDELYTHLHGKKAIVRVNDRGPFHEGRIVDLSYAAAVKLGIHKMGTAAVSLEVISAPAKGPEKWLQVSALSNNESAKSLQVRLQKLQPWPVFISSNPRQDLHKVRVGPIPEGIEIEKVKQLLIEQQLPEPLVLAGHQL